MAELGPITCKIICEFIDINGDYMHIDSTLHPVQPPTKKRILPCIVKTTKVLVDINGKPIPAGTLMLRTDIFDLVSLVPFSILPDVKLRREYYPVGALFRLKEIEESDFVTEFGKVTLQMMRDMVAEEESGS